MSAAASAAATASRLPTRPARTPGQEATDRAIGRRLGELRRAAGLSQTELGKALGVTYQQAHKYEAGKNGLSATRLIAICAVLGCEPHEVLYGVAGGGRAAVAGTRRMRLARAVYAMPEESLHVVEAVAKALERKGGAP